jgi:hypothetical protein
MTDSIRASWLKMKVTEPYFKVKSLDRNKDGLVTEIEFTPNCKYDPYSDADVDLNDPIDKYAADNYYEQWNSYSNKFVVQDATRNMRDDMMVEIRTIYVANSEAKKPRTTKLYKFLYDFNVSGDLEKQELIVALIRYIRPHMGSHNRFDKGTECPHGQNFMHILEKMREKYESR